MFPNTLAGFVLTATALTMAPGLDTAMILRAAGLGGPRQGIFVAVGIALGCMCWGAAAALGIGTLLKVWPAVFDALRWAGAAYIGWLGVRLLRNPGRTLTGESGDVAQAITIREPIVRGFATNIMNPKVGLFYLTLLPQFVPNDASGDQAPALSAIHVAIALGWFTVPALLAGTLRPWLRRPRVIGSVDRLTGGLFVLLGLKLAI